jgi:MFS family permease
MRWRAAGGALREREFRLLLSGQAASYLGSGLVPVALAFAVLDLTGSAASLGYVLAAGLAPMVVFALVGGVVADRLPRRQVLLGADVVRGLAHGALALLLLTGGARLWHVIVLELVFGTANAAFHPAATGFVPETVSPWRLQQANALLGLARSSAAIAGPVLAGILVAVGGPGWALAADAATFALSAWFLVRLRPSGRAPAQQSSRSFLGELRDGWDEFRSRPWLWATVAYSAFFNCLVLGPFFVLGPVVANRELGGPAAWAAIMTALGIGSLLGGAVALRVRPGRPLVVGLVLMLAYVPLAALLAAPASVPAIAAAALVAQAASIFFAALWSTSLQEQVPKRAISRVTAYDVVGSFALLPVGVALAGPVAGLVGTHALLWLSAGWMAVSTLAVLSVPGVRALRRAESAPAQPERLAA